MATETPTPLLSHRIVIVTGKGGTGKTTVATALALAAAQRGLRVLLAEVGSFEHVPTLLGDDGPVGYAGRTLRPGLHVMRIDPFEAVAEYIGLQIGSKRLVDLALQSRALHQLLAGAPGWRELVTLGKTWHMEQMREADRRPRYDLIVIDAPATGHGVTFLDVPRVVYSAVRSGPLARNTKRVEDLMRDPGRTLVLPVSLAEELPVQETAELAGRVRGELGMGLDRVVVNQLVAGSPDPPGLDAALSALPADLPLRALPSPRALLACTRHRASRRGLCARYLGEIESRTGLPTLRLPQLASGIDGDADLLALGERLLAAPRSGPEPADPEEPAARERGR